MRYSWRLLSDLYHGGVATRCFLTLQELIQLVKVSIAVDASVLESSCVRTIQAYTYHDYKQSFRMPTSQPCRSSSFRLAAASFSAMRGVGSWMAQGCSYIYLKIGVIGLGFGNNNHVQVCPSAARSPIQLCVCQSRRGRPRCV